jgi:hypothetical protein
MIRLDARPSRRPATSGDRLRLLTVVALAAAGLGLLVYVVLGHGPTAPPWVSATAADASFTARFPRPPAVATTPIGDGLSQNTLTWSGGPDELYLATSRWIGVSDPAGEQQALDAATAQIGGISDTAMLATPFRGHRARRYRGQSGGTSMQGLFFIDGGVLYSAVAIGPKAVAHAGPFFDSLHPQA